MANFNGNYPYGGASRGLYRDTTLEVGQFKSNAWGLHDMHGNVWEWCADRYGDYPDGSVTDPEGPRSRPRVLNPNSPYRGSSRINRGGSCIDRASRCRSAFRRRNGSGIRCHDTGFRLLRAVPEPD